MSDTEITKLRLQLALTNVDLQLYKGSIYKLRWGTPGGIDQALPCYDEAARVLDDTAWPSELQSLVGALRDRVAVYRETLVKKDVTSASAENTRMMRAFEALREAGRVWPSAPATATNGATNGAMSSAHAGMEAPGT
jgi:hypothetical protein